MPESGVYADFDDYRKSCAFLLHDDINELGHGSGLLANEDPFAQLQAALLGTTEEAKSALFWTNIDYSGVCWAGQDSALLDAVAINGDVTYLLSNTSNMFWHFHTSGGCDKLMGKLASAYVNCVTESRDLIPSQAYRWEQLIDAALAHGYDFHGNGSGRGDASPLLCLLHDSSRTFQTAEVLQGIKESLQVWLTLLRRKGVDLCTYGQEEKRHFQKIRQTCERPWDSWHGMQRHDCAQSAEKKLCWDDRRLDTEATLLTFCYGAEPSDWEIWLMHPGDQYAGYFWRMVEQEQDRDRLQRMPGGWVEDLCP